MSMIIHSSANRTYKRLLALHKSRGIIKYGRALVPGIKVVDELLRREREKCVALIHSEDSRIDLGVDDVASITLSRSLFRELDRWGAGSPLLLVEIGQFPVWEDREWRPGCTLILPLQDPRNLGAALRSATAFGVKEVVLTKEAAHPMNPEAVRPTAGVVGLLDIYRGPGLRHVADLPRPLLVLDLHGSPINDMVWPSAFGLIVGMEGSGVPGDMEGAERITIPMVSTVQSLNATAAVSVALYAWRFSQNER